jgi:hypothetical protein
VYKSKALRLAPLGAVLVLVVVMFNLRKMAIGDALTSLYSHLTLFKSICLIESTLIFYALWAIRSFI